MNIKPQLFQTKILDWYDKNQRVLPWRESRNPYHIWVSEIMLQQTRVETVIPYYHRFIAELPTIIDLAQASDETIYKLWEGLGYYSRVRNLRKAANQILETFEGVIPKNRKDLESLSGIGPYTSGAISSIAFDQKNAAVDGNVLRIFARLLGLKKSIKELPVKKEIKKTVESLLPNKRIGDFNQGLMEIGATICIPNGQPKCMICPLNDICKAFNSGTTNEIPVKQKKKTIPSKEKTVLLLKYKDTYAIEKRSDTGLLRSMYQFPLLDGTYTSNEVSEYLNVDLNDITQITSSKHKFSHLQWNMCAYEVTLSNKIMGYQYVSKDELASRISIPSAFKAYKNHIFDIK